MEKTKDSKYQWKKPKVFDTRLVQEIANIEDKGK